MASAINRLRGSLRIMAILLNSSVFNRINALRDFVVNLPVIYAVGQNHVSVAPGAGRGRGWIVFSGDSREGVGEGFAKTRRSIRHPSFTRKFTNPFSASHHRLPGTPCHQF